MRCKLFVLIGASCLLLPSAASADTLGQAGIYGEFIFGNSTRSTVDSRGPIAVGGNASLSSFTVAPSPLSPQSATAPNVVVGGNLNWSGNGSLNSGAVYTGGTATIASTVTIVSGTPTTQNDASLPVNFAADQAQLKAISAAQYSASDPTVTLNGSGALAFGTTTDTGLHVFNVTAANLFASNGFTVNGSSSATVIVDVTGTTAGTWGNGGFDIVGGITSSHIIWNFVSDTSFTLVSLGVDGTVLAPYAAVTFNNAQINGELIAASVTGSGETHIDQGGVNGGIDTRFSGTLRPSAVPEPASLAMIVVGGGMAGGFVRFRRAKARKATTVA